jgi:hypothetical protein
MKPIAETASKTGETAITILGNGDYLGALYGVVPIKDCHNAFEAFLASDGAPFDVVPDALQSHLDFRNLSELS